MKEVQSKPNLGLMIGMIYFIDKISVFTNTPARYIISNMILKANTNMFG